MRKSIVWILLLLFLTGCSDDSKELEAGIQLRSKLLQTTNCSFSANVTADYNDRLFQFTADCSAEPSGNVYFTITSPSTIAGISGKITGEEGQLTFSDMVLSFPLLAENLPSPISAPWIVLNSLRSGFLVSACKEDGIIRLSLDDSFEDDTMRLDIWLNQENLPQQADILNDGKRIMTMHLTNFHIS